MGGKKSNPIGSYASSWVKNPIENAMTMGGVAAYKAAGSATGAKLPTSSSVGIPSLLPGAQKVSGFDMPTSLKQAEMQMIQRQAAIAAGAAPSIAQMHMNRNVIRGFSKRGFKSHACIQTSPDYEPTKHNGCFSTGSHFG
jgi:hypothetical protein